MAAIAQRMEVHIGNNYLAYKTQVEGEPPGFLGCGGICTNCPWPEKDKYQSQQEQIMQCWASVEEDYLHMQGAGMLD